MNNNLLSSLGLAVSPVARAEMARMQERQDGVAKINALLGAQYRMEGIDAALNAADMQPDEAYNLLSANRQHPKLLLFYKALLGPGFRQ